MTAAGIEARIAEGEGPCIVRRCGSGPAGETEDKRPIFSPLTLRALMLCRLDATAGGLLIGVAGQDLLDHRLLHDRRTDGHVTRGTVGRERRVVAGSWRPRASASWTRSARDEAGPSGSFREGRRTAEGRKPRSAGGLWNVACTSAMRRKTPPRSFADDCRDGHQVPARLATGEYMSSNWTRVARRRSDTTPINRSMKARPNSGWRLKV